MSSSEPEEPKSGQDANWLRRQVQRGRAKETGDTIAAQVGEGAQHVAVGKNIIQIGSIQVPRWLAFAILGLLAIGVVVGGVTFFIGSNTQKDTQAALTILQATSTLTATPTVTPTPLPTSTPTPTPTPQRMNGDFNLVVGQFGQTDSQGDVVESELGTELSLWLARRLNRELTSEDVRANLGEVLVWNDDLNRLPGNPLIGVIHTEEEAARLVNDLKADMVISGVLSGPADAPILQLGFYYGRQRVRDEPDAALGGHLFGSGLTIPYANNPKEAVDKLDGPTPELPRRATALVWLVRALAKESLDEPVQALAIFKEAESQLGVWTNLPARSVFYYFMGRTALLLNSLEEAQRAFEQAVSDDPQNVPAQIGLGSYHYTLAQLYFTRQQPMTTTVAMCANAFAAGQIDVNEIAANASKVPADFPQAQAALAQAQAQYRLALDLASQPEAPMPYLAHIARLMLASAYRLAGEGQIYQFDEQDAAGTPMPELLDQASTQLTQADDLYRQTIDPLKQEERFGLLAYAHYGLGLSQRAQGYVDQKQNAGDRAKQDYAQAIDSFGACSSLKGQKDGDGNVDLQERMSCFCDAYKSQVEQEYIDLGGGEG